MRVTKDQSYINVETINIGRNLNLPKICSNPGNFAYDDGQFKFGYPDDCIETAYQNGRIKMTVKEGIRFLRNSLSPFYTNGTAKIPSGEVYITMVGGGGMGGKSTSSSGVFLGGGGGGAGEACMTAPINLPGTATEYWNVSVIIGNGGTLLSPNGGNTIITFTKEIDSSIINVVSSGGKGSVFNSAGVGGKGNFHKSLNGEDGIDGTIIYGPDASSAVGGMGGKSFISSYGRGGTGETYGQPSTRTQGSKGYVLIEF